MFFPFSARSPRSVAVFSRSGSSATSALVLVAARVRGALDVGVGAPHVRDGPRDEPVLLAHLDGTAGAPAGVEYFDLIATMWGGGIRSPRRCSSRVGFILSSSSSAGYSGIIVASPPLDYHVHDSMFVVAHFHYTLFAGSLFGLLRRACTSGGPRRPAGCSARGARESCSSALMVRGHEPHLRAALRARLRRHAAPRRRLLAVAGFTRLEHGRDARLVRARGRDPRLHPGTSGSRSRSQSPGRFRSVGRATRSNGGGSVTAATRELRPPAAGRHVVRAAARPAEQR